MRAHAIVLLALMTAGCSLKSVALRTTGSLLRTGSAAYHTEADPALAKDAMPGQLKLLESLLQSSPDDPRLLSALAEGYVGYSFLFLEDEAPERAKGLYRRAADYGMRLLGRKKRFRGLDRMRPEELDTALKGAGRGDVPALYWTAYALAGWANLDMNDPEALAALPRAARMMGRVLELDPGFQFGGPDIFFGVYYGVRPRIAGGDPEKSKAHFDAALSRGGGRYLTAGLLCAKYYAATVLDEALFRNLLKSVLEAPADALPEARLANEVAKLKAKKLLEKTDDLF
ncbi:MAG: TRAP transporter TatT component family protein [Elusimicrobiota bacterium]